jgi:16S rRNA processing protein RimM
VTQSQDWIVIGKITSAHGVRGEVKAQLFLDDPEFLVDIESLFLEGRPGRQEIGIKRLRLNRAQAIVSIEGISDRTEAERLRGREISIPSDWLPGLEEDEYYVAQIIGLTVETVDGELLGEVAEVIFTGANEVYVVRGGPRGEILLPAIESVVQAVEVEEGRILVAVPEGLLD